MTPKKDHCYGVFISFADKFRETEVIFLAGDFNEYVWGTAEDYKDQYGRYDLESKNGKGKKFLGFVRLLTLRGIQYFQKRKSLTYVRKNGCWL